MVTEKQQKEYLRKRNKAYFITDESYGNKDLLVQGDLMELVRGVNYIMDFYKDIEGFTSDNVLRTLLKVLEIERLRGTAGSIQNIDSFVREQVFDILTRELDN